MRSGFSRPRAKIATSRHGRRARRASRSRCGTSPSAPVSHAAEAARDCAPADAAAHRRRARAARSRPARRPPARRRRRACAREHDALAGLGERARCRRRASAAPRGRRARRSAKACARPSSDPQRRGAARPRARCRSGSRARCPRCRSRASSAADHARARLRVGHAVVDRVEREQRIAGKVHLRDQPLHRRVAEQREVDVLRAPGERVVLPRIGAGLDGDEAVPAVVVGEGAADAGEVRDRAARRGCRRDGGSGPRRSPARSPPASGAPGVPSSSSSRPARTIFSPSGARLAVGGEVVVAVDARDRRGATALAAGAEPRERLARRAQPRAAVGGCRYGGSNSSMGRPSRASPRRNRRAAP